MASHLPIAVALVVLVLGMYTDSVDAHYVVESHVLHNGTTGTCVSKESRQNAIKMIRDEISHILGSICLRGMEMDNPVSSCSSLPLSCESGYYWVKPPSGNVTQLYCERNPPFSNKTNTTTDSEVWWTRAVFLNMSDTTQQCPNTWRLVESPVRSCRRQNGSYNSSAVFTTYGIRYSQVCGRVVGYQFGTPEAFNHQTSETIDDTYVDGVSITYGNPRQHVWTFAGARSLTDSNSNATCPCTNPSQTVTTVPQFILNEYFCETAESATPNDDYFYQDNPLWDGMNCISPSTCCEFNNPPWFCKQLPESTTEDIEIRFLSYTTDPTKLESEDTPVELIELYIG